MYDLSDLSIIIPFRYDTEDRLDNLKQICRYFKTFYINYEIILIENDATSKISGLDMTNVVYKFNQDASILPRPQMMNDGARMSKRKFVSLYDTDVVFEPFFFNAAMQFLRNGHNFVFPFNGFFMNIEGKNKHEFLKDFNFNKLYKVESGTMEAVGKVFTKELSVNCNHFNSVGGATMFNKEIFLKYGGYNKKFKSWGFEDNEITHRFHKMGITPIRTSSSNLIHLDHRRGVDSVPNNGHYQQNMMEYQKVVNMSAEQLAKYIQTELI